MSEHTPGPWRYMQGTHSVYTVDGKAIALAYGPRGIACGWRDANARLIAAAPDLLEALKRLCSHGTRDHAQIAADWDFARAAIAKAEGV
jgi:hypothetical protein